MDKSVIGDADTLAGGSGGNGGGYTLASGDAMGQYRIVRPLGRGGMGEVYEAEHATLERRYALKLLPADFAAPPGALDRFRREARVMANLEHPHIVRVDDFGETAGRHWLRMELANGLNYGDRLVTSLQDLAEAGGGRVGQRDMAGILSQILRALAYAHGRGAVHRDLKPSNILIFSDAEGSLFKIADFGLVRLVGEEWVRGRAQLTVQRSLSMGDARTLGGPAAGAEGTSTRSLLGTYEYMSPEQKHGGEAAARSDLYSVGLMAFKLLTGQNPGLKPPSRIDPSLDKGWDALLERALEEDPAGRWPDAAAMLDAVREIGESLEGERHRSTGGGGQAGRGTAETEVRAEPPCEPPARTSREPGDTETVDLGGGAKLELVWCPPGSFVMGSPENETGRRSDETQHRVTLTKGFWMGRHEVTQAQWEAVTGSNPSHFKTDKILKLFGGQTRPDHPVEAVSWYDCQEFIRKVNARVPGGGFRLPTEAEWEYACRAGTAGPYAGNLDDMAWYGANSGSTTHPVGQKKPNAWGLHDMHGNVWEWCQDWYGDYPTGGVTDPAGPGSGSIRVNRGGGWDGSAGGCRSASRLRGGPGDRDGSLGLRLARNSH